MEGFQTETDGPAPEGCPSAHTGGTEARSAPASRSGPGGRSAQTLGEDRPALTGPPNPLGITLHVTQNLQREATLLLKRG